ncbi:hypothetical protein L1887_11389 [Cichorium endivia]|nr:hypothetical protein L1887_11389 [Cichorium endivia]
MPPSQSVPPSPPNALALSPFSSSQWATINPITAYHFRSSATSKHCLYSKASDGGLLKDMEHVIHLSGLSSILIIDD